MERIENVIITSMRWDNDHGLSHWIFVAGDTWGCGFGGYNLMGEAAYDWISQIMKTLEISELSDEKVIGKIVRVKTGGVGTQITAIGHPIKEIWFEPAEFFKKYTKK